MKNVIGWIVFIAIMTGFMILFGVLGYQKGYRDGVNHQISVEQQTAEAILQSLAEDCYVRNVNCLE